MVGGGPGGLLRPRRRAARRDVSPGCWRSHLARCSRSRAPRGCRSCWCRWSAMPCARSMWPSGRSMSTCASWARSRSWTSTCSRCSPRRSAGSRASATWPTRSPTVTGSSYVNYREHTPLTGGQVDDTPFGGGAGMVLRVDVVEAAMRARYGLDPVELRGERRVIALTPAGRVLDDALVDELAAEPALTLLSGRYEGFDERVLEHFAGEEISIGRYVLAGGELAAMVVCDAVLRKLPGALGHEDSAHRGIVQPGARGRARIPALHPARRLPRLERPAGAALGPPRPDPRVAPGPEPHARQVELSSRAIHRPRTRGRWRCRFASIGRPRRSEPLLTALVPFADAGIDGVHCHEHSHRQPGARSTAPRTDV